MIQSGRSCLVSSNVEMAALTFPAPVAAKEMFSAEPPRSSLAGDSSPSVAAMIRIVCGNILFHQEWLLLRNGQAALFRRLIFFAAGWGSFFREFFCRGIVQVCFKIKLVEIVSEFLQV